MDQIAKALTDIAASVEILEWVDAPDHGDAGDFQALGHVASEVLALPIHPAPLRDVVRAERILGTGHVPIRSAQTRSQSGAELELPFRTAREFASETAPEVDWIAGRYVAAGAITQVEGKIKSAGKTTLVTHLCRAVLTGSSFLGEPTRRTAVVYLTEQTGASLREALRRADLLERDDFVLLSWAQVPAVSWPDLVAAVAAECGRREAQLLVVDTLSRFAGIRGDGENSAGEADAAMAPLQLAAAQGLGIILVRHERKAGGDVGDAGRGSSAFGGAVDILVAVRRLPGDGPANRRTLQALSRFDETPDLLIVELTDSGYVALGDEMAVARAQAQAEVLEFLADAGAIGCRMDDLVTPNRPRTTVQRVLDELVEAADVARLGKGVKGHPFRFALTELLEAAAPVVKEAPTAESLLPGIEGLAELFRNLGSDIDALGELQ